MDKLKLEDSEEKATISDKLKDGVKSLFSIFKKDNTIKFKTPEEAMGEIYKLMVELEKDRKRDKRNEHKDLKKQDNDNERRNKQLIKALTGLTGKPKPQSKSTGLDSNEKLILVFILVAIIIVIFSFPA